MTAIYTPIVNPEYQFMTNNGMQSLSGGQLFVYLAGTTTKTTTWKDANGITPNTNPVILDSNGRCTIFGLANAAVKFVLTSSTDTDPPTSPFWTVDNIPLPTPGVDYSSYLSIVSNILNIQKVQLNDLNNTPVLAIVNAGLELVSDLPILDSSSHPYISFQKTTGAVNNVQISNATTTNPPTIMSAGSDSTVPLSIDTKGANILSLGNVNATSIVLGTTAATTISIGTGASTTVNIGQNASATTIRVGQNTMPTGKGTVGQNIRNGTTAGVLAFNSAMHFENVQSFTSSGSFAIPADVTLIYYKIWGGGGGGGGGNGTTTLGSGGGGAGFGEGLASVTAGGTITVTIGTGGTAASAGSAGGAGVSTTLTGGGLSTTKTASGGSGGTASSASQNAGGGGGGSSNNTLNFPGSQGGSTHLAVNAIDAGFGGLSPQGGGNVFGAVGFAQTGLTGIFPGGGGGGSGTAAGAAGAAGFCVIYY